MKKKERARLKRQVSVSPKIEVKKKEHREPRIRYFAKRDNTKSTKWERSYMSLAAAVVFLLLVLWYLVHSSKH
jgi:hypothetical protein